jgi:hypothetical protein
MGHRESVSRSAARRSGPPYVPCIEIPGWSKPPFSFEGVTMRVFPLRADPQILQGLIDKSLNIFPDDARFRVFLPYVYLILLDYGKMSIDAANLGWISQHEVTFSIPLEWYAPGKDGKDGEEERFQDWAYYSPFIFVDNVLSMTVGRQVYGWPKKLAFFNESVSNWTRDPRAPANLAGIRTGTYLKLYAGQRPRFRTFLEVEQRPFGSLLGLPPDPRAPWLPWMSIPTGIVSSLELFSDFTEILRGMQLLPPFARGNVQDRREMLARAFQMLRPSSPDLAYNTINLKEFRDAEHVDAACYQAITNARMKVTRFNGAGMLGDLRVLTGDPSGGMVVRLYDFPSLPIVTTLGLKAKADGADEGLQAYTLEPVFPFWVDVNMFYALGDVLVSYPPSRPRESPSLPKARPPEVAPIAGSVGLTGQQVTGPFQFGGAIVRVLPLRADRDRLQRLCDRYLNHTFSDVQDGGLTFEPWGRYVYLVAYSYGEMASKTNNVGWWADRELGLYMPVLVYGRAGADGTRPLRTAALVPVLGYADGGGAEFADSEVNGLPMVEADIESPPDTWMDQVGPGKKTVSNLLRLRTVVLPVLGLGQPAEERTLVEIVSGEVIPSGDADKRRIASQKWSPLLRDELQSRHALGQEDLKVGRALAAELLSGAAPFNVLTLKQFRDCEDPEQACYQSLVNLKYTLQEVLDLREIEEPLHVRIHGYPSQPIVETLGLIPRSQDYEDGTVVYNIEAIRPFWMKVNLHVSLGQNLSWRTIKRGWTSGCDPWRCYFDPDRDGGPGVRAELDDALERQLPRELTFAVREWKRKNAEAVAHQGDEGKAAFLSSARKALAALEPQAVLETILSREWENRGRTLWSQEMELIHQELIKLAKGPGSLEEKLKELDERLDLLQKEVGGAPIHHRVRRELLGQRGLVQEPGSLLRLRSHLQQIQQVVAQTPGGVGQVPEQTQAVESWFSLLQHPSVEADEELLTDTHDGVERDQALSGEADESFPALALNVAFWLMRFRQKPDFCLRREVLLDLEVPEEEVYGPWYVGKELRGPGGS